MRGQHGRFIMRRFFADDSFWNTPIPADVRIAEGSAAQIAFLAQMRPEGVWVNHEHYTIPVYAADGRTPRHRIHRRFAWNSRFFRPEMLAAARTHLPEDFPLGHGPGFGVEVPIPVDAMQDPDGDQHLAIVDWERRLGWDMWGAQRRPDGGWEAGTGMVYALDGAGVFDPAMFPVRDGESLHLYGPSRAAGVPTIAGLIMRDEIVAGGIEHKLSFASSAVALQQFIFPPACWTDGPIPGGIPEGAVVQLDPALDLGGLPLSRTGMIIARAWQKYGAVCVDGAGGNVVYAEGLYGSQPRNWQGLLQPREVEALGYEHFRIVDLGGRLIAGGDTGHPVWPVAAAASGAAAERAKIRPWPTA